MTKEVCEMSAASADSASSGTDADRQALADSSGPTKPARLYFVPPPEMLVDALHDPVGPTSGRRIRSKRFGTKK